MKSYTDLEQSKKLAKILPFESADNYYSWHDERYYIVNKDCPYPYSLKEKIPCWSLASLLEQLPYELCDDDGNSVYLKINKEDDMYQLEYKEDHSDDFYSIETDRYEHFVDACYELILKAHESNLL